MRSVADTQFTLRGAPAALVALLAAARAQGAIITRTKAAKLLYLADLRAVEKIGRPGSGVEWRWLHYGPFSLRLLSIEEDHVGFGVIGRETTQNYFGGVEYRLRLSRAASIDIDAEFAEIIEHVVLEYGEWAASSLRDLTYQTPPMLEAQRESVRGEALDLLSGHPVPDMTPALNRFQTILDRVGRQEDEGDLSALTEEIADWAPHRADATRALIDDD
jgi:uncharacterized phage-associated protein